MQPAEHTVSLAVLERLWLEHPAIVEKLLAFLAAPPEFGRAEITFRRGKLAGLTTSEATYPA